jgi:hypothetical protein
MNSSVQSGECGKSVHVCDVELKARVLILATITYIHYAFSYVKANMPITSLRPKAVFAAFPLPSVLWRLKIN